MADGLALALEAVETLASEDIDGGYLGDELIALYGAIDRLRAQASRRLAVFDARGEGTGDGFKSTAAWLSAKCRMHPLDAARAVRVARLERHLPDLTDLWEAGATTAAHVERVARVRHHAKADEHFDALAPTWASLCRGQDTIVLGQALAGFVDRLDNTRPTEDSNAVKAIDRRMLIGSECLGAGLMEARWDLTDYQYVMDAVDAERDRAHCEGDARTIDQERADALVTICRRDLADHARSCDLPADIGIVTDTPTLAGIEAGLCETDRGLPLCVETVRRLCCNARIGRILVDSEGEILDLGVAKRLFSVGQRRAMRYRDRGCCFPGCCRPVKQCEAHHIRPWDDGGPTDLENGCMLCYAHHRLVHELRWTITRRPDGGIDWHKPDRSYHATWHPPGRPPPIRLL